MFTTLLLVAKSFVLILRSRGWVKNYHTYCVMIDFQLEVLPIPFNLTLIIPSFLYCFKCLNSYRENLLKILARPRSLIPVNVLSSKMSLLKFPHIIYLFIQYFVLFSPFPFTCLISLLLLLLLIILLILLINTDERHAR